METFSCYWSNGDFPHLSAPGTVQLLYLRWYKNINPVFEIETQSGPWGVTVPEIATSMGVMKAGSYLQSNPILSFLQHQNGDHCIMWGGRVAGVLCGKETFVPLCRGKPLREGEIRFENND